MAIGSPDDRNLDSLTGDSVTYGEARSSALTPMGEVESLGGFARGLGARRVKFALVVSGVSILALAAATAIF